jgi:hypothetical protein
MIRLLLVTLLFTLCEALECVPELRPVLSKIQQIPEARALIGKIEAEGSIQIKYSTHAMPEQFGACWDYENRIIYLSRKEKDEGNLIGSVIFELHNASVNAQLNRLDRLAEEGKISRNDYIRSVEHLEYLNSKNASSIADKGIKAGLFPGSARLNTYDSFEEHYRVQQKYGHSEWIGKNFDQIVNN